MVTMVKVVPVPIVTIRNRITLADLMALLVEDEDLALEPLGGLSLILLSFDDHESSSLKTKTAPCSQRNTRLLVR